MGTLMWRARGPGGIRAQAEAKMVLPGDLLGPCLGFTEGPGNLGGSPCHPCAGGLRLRNPDCPQHPSHACSQRPHGGHGRLTVSAQRPAESLNPPLECDTQLPEHSCYVDR